MAPKFFFDLMSQPCRAVHLFLKLAKIPHINHEVALRKGVHRTQEFKENVSPFGLVPVLHDNDFRLTESVAIIQYLSNKYPNSETEKLYPTDLRRRAKIDAFNNWQHLNLRLGGATVFQACVAIPHRTGKEVDQNLVRVGMGNLKKSLNVMEGIFLKDTPYIYGDHLSTADLLGICELMQPHYGVGVDVFTGYPSVKRWAEAVRQNVGEELFDEVHAIIKRPGANYRSSGQPIPEL